MSDNPEAKNAEERVGYGRPPKHTRFQKGNRANPRGRGNRDRADFAESVRSTLAGTVEIREGHRTRRVSRAEANILLLFDKAKRGDAPAADRLLDLYEASVRGDGDGPLVIEVHNALPQADGKYRDQLLADGSGRRPPRKDIG